MSNVPISSLAHAGVKGMRWGKRKGVSSSSSDRKKEVESLAKRPVSSLTNKQLKAANNRLQMEKTYASLQSDSKAKSSIDAGKKIVKTITGSAGTAILLYNMANSPAAKAGLAFIRRAATTAVSSGALTTGK